MFPLPCNTGTQRRPFVTSRILLVLFSRHLHPSHLCKSRYCQVCHTTCTNFILLILLSCPYRCRHAGLGIHHCHLTTELENTHQVLAATNTQISRWLSHPRSHTTHKVNVAVLLCGEEERKSFLQNRSRYTLPNHTLITTNTAHLFSDRDRKLQQSRNYSMTSNSLRL